MHEQRDPWVRTTSGWLMPADTKGPIEGHHGPHARHFSSNDRMWSLLLMPVVFLAGMFIIARRELANGTPPNDPAFLMGAAIVLLAGGAFILWALHTAKKTRGAIVIDPVEGYIDLPAHLLSREHRAAPGVTSPTPGRARIAFADLTRAERRELNTRRHRSPWLYIADRHGEVSLYIDEPQINAALALIVGEDGWLAKG